VNRMQTPVQSKLPLALLLVLATVLAAPLCTVLHIYRCILA
jgi:hypothetical protein